MTQVSSSTTTSLSGPATGVAAALARNRAFAARGGHEGAVVFPKLRLFVVTCLDPRVDPAHVLGLDLSDAIVVRNAGGLVTPELIGDVAFIGQLAETLLPDGPLFEVAVIHHTQCGTGALADDSFRRRYAERIGADEATLRDHAILDPAATVRRDVERLRSADSVSPRINLSGHVYDVVSGLVQTIIPADTRATRAVAGAGAETASDELGQSAYADSPAHTRSALATAHTLLERGVISEAELQAKMDEVRQPFARR